MKQLRIALLSVMATLLLSCSALAQKQKEVVTSIVTFVAPSSFDELWNDADAVVHVKVLGSRGTTRAQGNPEIRSPSPFTEHRVRIIEVFRGPDALTGFESKVLQKAGEVITEDKIFRIADEVPLRVGAEYVVCLHWHKMFSQYEIWQGQLGIFEVRDDRIRPASKWRVSQEHADKRKSDFIGELRARKAAPR